MQSIAASAVDRELAMTPTFPPTQFNYARWNTNAACLQSRIGNVEFTVIQATLVNDTGAWLPMVDVGCDLGAGFVSAEQVPGFRGYYSFSGEPGTWLVIPQSCTGVPGKVSAVLSFEQFGAWSPGALLYLLWADDNGAGSDGYYTIDSFYVGLAPVLNIRQSETGGVEVSWPAAWSNHFLEVSPSLSPPDWQTAVGLSQSSDGRMRMLLESADEQRFFRTRKQIVFPSASVALR